MVGSVKGLVAGLAGSLLLTLVPAAAHADHPLEPDLITVALAAKELSVESDGKKTLLRLGNRVGNIGAGPLEIRPGPASTDCDGDGNSSNDLPGSQRIYEHSWTPGGDNEMFEDTSIGCVRYHPPHNHWHVASIARYSLYDEVTGELTEGNKVGFCLLDSGIIDGFPAGPVGYNASGCGSGTTVLPTVTGISPGYFDFYAASTAGQRINVTGVARGKYCLRSTSNPVGEVAESDSSNNTAEMRIRLNPVRGVVKKLGDVCAAP